MMMMVITVMIIVIVMLVVAHELGIVKNAVLLSAQQPKWRIFASSSQ